MPVPFLVRFTRANGATERVFLVGATERALYGVYVDGVPYGPDGAEIHDKLPARVRPAFDRAGLWCGTSRHGDLFRADLRGARRADLGTVQAAALSPSLRLLG